MTNKPVVQLLPPTERESIAEKLRRLADMLEAEADELPEFTDAVVLLARERVLPLVGCPGAREAGLPGICGAATDAGDPQLDNRPVKRVGDDGVRLGAGPAVRADQLVHQAQRTPDNLERAPRDMIIAAAHLIGIDCPRHAAALSSSASRSRLTRMRVSSPQRR